MALGAKLVTCSINLSHTGARAHHALPVIAVTEMIKMGKFMSSLSNYSPFKNPGVRTYS